MLNSAYLQFCGNHAYLAVLRSCQNRTDWEMGPYIHSLDRSYSYFAISGMDKGLHMW